MKKLKNVYVLTTAAIVVALAVVLGFFKIPVNEFVEIRFQYLALAVGGGLFGPAIGGIIGMLSDILGYVVKPTGAYFPGFTISSIVAAVIYALFFYKKKITLLRVVLAELTVTVVRSIFLNTINLSILYGNGFWAVLSTRLVKTIVMFPINAALLYFVMKLLPKLIPPRVREQFDQTEKTEE